MTILRAATAALCFLTAVCGKCLGATSEPLLLVVQKGVPPQRLIPEAEVPALRFLYHLDRQEWDKALALTSSELQTAAKIHYPSSADFFQQVVPLPEIQLQHRAVKSTVRDEPNGPERIVEYYFDVVPSTAGANEPAFSWRWSLLPRENEWAVSFTTLSLQAWLESRRTSRIAAAAERRIMHEERLKFCTGLSVSLEISSRTLISGQPLYLAARLTNDSDKIFFYDACHWEAYAMTGLRVSAPDAKPVRYISPPTQTAYSVQRINPGDSILLFEGADIAQSFDLAQPGRYTIQMQGPLVHRMDPETRERESLTYLESNIATFDILADHQTAGNIP